MCVWRVITCFPFVAMGYRAQSWGVGPSTLGGNNRVSLWEKKKKIEIGSRETMGKSTKIGIPRWPDCEQGSQAAETTVALHKPSSHRTHWP